MNLAPIDLSSGIELNTDGGNDAFLVTDGDAILGGLSSLTYEVQFAADLSDQLAETTLVSYAADATFGNDFKINIENTGGQAGQLIIVIDDVQIGSSALDYRDLLDGGFHSLGYTWDCLLYTSPSPRDATLSRMPSSA